MHPERHCREPKLPTLFWQAKSGRQMGTLIHADPALRKLQPGLAVRLRCFILLRDFFDP
jgi:hypothetical protein